jgi:hypothetical protein
MGAPGLAFETWDPSNQFPLETPTPSLSSRAERRDLQCFPWEHSCAVPTELPSRPKVPWDLWPIHAYKKPLGPATARHRTVALSFVIPSGAEGSAVFPMGTQLRGAHRIVIPTGA